MPSHCTRRDQRHRQQFYVARKVERYVGGYEYFNCLFRIGSADYETPSHGGNTGSNPVGDTNKINNIEAKIPETSGPIRKIYGICVCGRGRTVGDESGHFRCLTGSAGSR
jgi:hypothetical protein